MLTPGADTSGLISSLVETACKKDCGVIPGVPMEDTVKNIDSSSHVEKTLDRRRMMRIQTPQVFPYQKLLKAYRFGVAGGVQGTDDASFYEAAGGIVYVVPGEEENLKITLPADLQYFRYLLNR